jgi:hypothetical protein
MSLGSILGGIAGLVIGGGSAMAAAVGAGIGRLASGGDIEDAVKDGALAFGIGSIPGVGNFAKSAAGNLGISAAGKQVANKAIADKAAEGVAKGTSGLLTPGNILLATTVAGALEGKDKQDPGERFPGGERLPDYQGRVLVKPFYSPITNKRYMTQEEMDRDVAASGSGIMSAAAGGYIEGPGTGRSDDVKAGIFQNGQKVQEARLSDGEFVMTEKAVRNAGGGDREKGAAKMYSLMNNLERGVA